MVCISRQTFNCRRRGGIRSASAVLHNGHPGQYQLREYTSTGEREVASLIPSTVSFIHTKYESKGAPMERKKDNEDTRLIIVGFIYLFFSPAS